jgi:hypothetical protein
VLCVTFWHVYHTLTLMNLTRNEAGIQHEKVMEDRFGFVEASLDLFGNPECIVAVSFQCVGLIGA